MAGTIIKKGASGTIILIVLIMVAMNFYKTIPPGHVGVATLFGKVEEQGYQQGFTYTGESTVSLDSI